MTNKTCHFHLDFHPRNNPEIQVNLLSDLLRQKFNAFILLCPARFDFKAEYGRRNDPTVKIKLTNEPSSWLAVLKEEC